MDMSIRVQAGLAELRKMKRQMEAAREIERARADLICELAPKIGKSHLAVLAEHSGLTRGRVHQIIKAKNGG